MIPYPALPRSNSCKPSCAGGDIAAVPLVPFKLRSSGGSPVAVADLTHTAQSFRKS